MRIVVKGTVVGLRTQYFGKDAPVDGELEIYILPEHPDWQISGNTLKIPIKISEAPRVGAETTIILDISEI